MLSNHRKYCNSIYNQPIAASKRSLTGFESTLCCSVVRITGALNHSLCLVWGSVICTSPTVGFFYDVFSLLKNTHPGPDHVRTCCSCKFIFVPLFTFRSWYKRKKTSRISWQTWKRAQVFLHCYSLPDKRVRGFVFPQGERGRIRSLCHLIWRLRLTLRSFVFLSLQHNRVCLAVSTLSK